MWFAWFLYFFIVSYLLSPGVLMPIPRRYRLQQVAAIHALIIAVVLVILTKPLMRRFSQLH